MERSDVIRAAVIAAGPRAFRALPQLTEKPLDHLDDLREIASALSRYERRVRGEDQELARRVCESFVSVLETPRLPAGVAALAAVIEHLSLAVDDNTWRRGLWLRLAKNRRAFIRRRFTRALRDGLLQAEADELWTLYLEKGDFEILHNLALADASIRLPRIAIAEMEELEGQGYLLSRTLAHHLYENGVGALRAYRRRFPISALYAAGFSGRKDLSPYVLRVLRKPRSIDDERKAALGALARLGDGDTVLGVAAGLLENRKIV